MTLLPTPSEEGVETFNKMCVEEFGLILSDEEAVEAATRALHLVFIQAYCQKYFESRH